jgi:hypothetical protein
MKGNWNDILGNDIPNLMKSVLDLEKKIQPNLVLLRQNKDKIDPEIMAKIDKQLAEIKQIKKDGNINYK